MDDSRVVIAEILRERGNRGEVTARCLSDVPGRLEQLKRAQVRLSDGADRDVEIEEAWEHKGDWVLKFFGVDSIEAAEAFRGADVWVPPSERAELPPGEFFQSDLTGCEVVDNLSGRCLGKVEGWHQFGGAPLMELTVDGRETLIPFVSSQCQVDLTARVIRLDLLDGLLNL
jgi:16S rRNA processing protein RimM